MRQGLSELLLKRRPLEIILSYGSLFLPLILLFGIVEKRFYLISSLLLSLSFYLELKRRYLPRFLINALGILFILLFFFTVTLSNFLESALRTLLLLLALKFLEEKTLRDYFQIYLLEFLMLCGCTFYFAEVSFFLLLLLGIIYYAFSLFLHFYLSEGEVFVLQREELKDLTLTFGSLLLVSLFLSGIFFLTLPRLQNPLFNLATPEKGKAKTGFTDKISLGSFSEIQESSAPVLRLVFDPGFKPNPSDLYLKVITFDYFDGKTWKRSLEPEERFLRSPKTGLKKVEIYLLAEQEGRLPVPEGTYFVRGKFLIKGYRDGTFRTFEALSYPIKYEAFFGDFVYAEELPEIYLQVPEGLDERIKELARRLKGRTERETLENILAYFKKEGFRYALRGLPTGDKALSQFLFEVKRGNCEYFAGATALLLRLNGIPARVVGGYHGALYHPQGGYFLVLEKFAHSWVEAYLEGRWIRVEPSPASSITLFERKRGLLDKLRLYYDLVNHYYTRLILDYDLARQKRLLEILSKGLSLGFKRGFQGKGEGSDFLKDFVKREAPSFLIYLLLLAGLFGLLWFLLFKKGILFKKKERRLLDKFFRLLAKKGYERRPGEGLFELVERIEDNSLKERALRFAKIYGAYYYKDKPFDREGLLELERCLKELQNLKLSLKQNLK